MRKLLIAGLVTLATLCAAPARANSVDLTMTNIGLSNVLGGVYIGPYTVETTGTTNTFQVICDQFLADTYIGESWVASVGSLSGTAGDEIAFLATALFDYSSSTLCGNGSACTGGVNNAADIQYALWQVFDPGLGGALYSAPGGPLPLGDITNALAWLATASSTEGLAAGAADASNFVVYTPTSCINGPGCSGTSNLPQEFIGRTPVPEPGTLLLLGIGMLGIVFYGRRKPRQGDVTA